MKATIGVAIATYNGEKFVRQQIDSILKQSRLPDLISISDDGSADKTLEIIQSIFDQRPNISTIVQQSHERLGVHENFLRAISACDTELVILADQDDWWYPRKIEVIAQRMQESDVHGCVHAYENVFEAAGVRKHIALPNETLLGSDISPLFNWPGMAMAFRRKILHDAVNIRDAWRLQKQEIQKTRNLDEFDGWADWHDNLFLTTARLGGRIAFVSESVGVHRLHSSNVSAPAEGWKNNATIDTTRDLLADRYKSRAAFLTDFAKFGETVLGNGGTAKRQAYEIWAKIFQDRATLNIAPHFSQRAACFIRMAAAGAYRGAPHRGLGFKSAVKDFSVVFGLERHIQKLARVMH